MGKYIDNEEFLRLILNHKQTNSRESFEKLGVYFLKIVNHLLFRPNFVNYTKDIKDDIRSDACFYMTKYLYNFDIEKGKNPFGYFTKISWQAAVNVINKFHKYEEMMVNFSNMDGLNEFDTENEDYCDDNYYKIDANFITDEIRRMNSYF